MNEFFKKYILKSSLVTIIFFLTNIFIFFLFAFLYIINDNSEVSQVTIREIISARESKDTKYLEERLGDDFYFILNTNGGIVESMNLPKELNHHYTNSQIASFTRWYLEDYPVLTRVLEDGEILVLGMPKGTYIKYNFTITYHHLFWELAIIPFFLLGNLCLCLFFQIHSTRRLQKEIIPITDSIEKIAQGEDVYIKPQGELTKVKEEVNRTSKLIQQKEAARRAWVRDISHDIRTPLLLISNSAELIEEDKNSEAVSIILKNIQRLKRLVEKLNLENRLNAGNIPLNKKSVNLYLYLNECLADFFNHQLENDTHSFNINISRDLEKICFDLGTTRS